MRIVLGAIVCGLAAAAGLALLQEWFVLAMALLLLLVFGLGLLLLVVVFKYLLEVLEQVQGHVERCDGMDSPPLQA